MKSNGSGCGIVKPQISLSLAALFVVCLALSPVASQAQTYTPNYIYTVVGGGATASAPFSATLPGASAAIEDSSGNVYIAAPDTAYVFKLTSAGTFGNYAGLGYGGHNADGGQASKSLIFAVTGLAMDSKGNIYFADAAGSRIREVSPKGVISTVAGNGDKCDHAEVCGDGGLAINANLNLPESVALDAAGNIYIADANNNRIRVVNTQKTTITIAGVSIPAGYIQAVAGLENDIAGCSNSQTACGDGGPATSAYLNLPYGVALDHVGNIYIADTDDHKIRVVNAQSSTITIAGVSIAPGNIATVAGNGIACTNPVSKCGDGKVGTSAEITRPQGVFIDASSNILIADTDDSRIREVTAATSLMSTVVNTAGTPGFTGDGGAASSAQLDLPGGIWEDSQGDYFIPDSGNARVRVVNNQAAAITVGGTTIQPGDIQTIAGGGNGGDGGSPTQATLALPWDVVEYGGNLYIVDQGDNRVREVINPLSSSPTITTVAGNGTAGYSGDGGLATAAALNAPSSVAFDGSGNMYIADSNNLVVREVAAATGIISTVVGNGSSCYPTTAACGDGGVATSASFSFPLNVTFDLPGNLYISDWQGYKIRKVVPSGGSIAAGTISTIAGTGTSGSKGNGGLATKANLNHPAGLVVDSNGNVYISDQYNNEVRQVDTSGIISQWALNADAKLAGDGLPALQGSMWNPLELAIDPSNNVYISGGNNNVVQRISAATTIYSTAAGTSTNSIQGGFSGDNGPAANAHMANLGAWVDGNSNLWIADGGNNRVRYVPLTPAGTATPATLPLGQWALGVAGGSQPVTLTSSGGEDLSLTGFSFSGTNSADFSQTNTCGSTPATISPDVSCTISVTLTPSQYGPETATMNINDNGAGSPQTVTLTGSGPDFAISASPNTLTVTHGNAGTSTITLKPQAKFTATVAVTCSGAPANSTCTLNPVNVKVPPGSPATTTLTIQTTATTAPGTYTLTVTGVYSNLSNPTTISLTVQ
ncbi:MAG: choice-of-anchor D domain-containing protein [Candidatus Sulfotelmatobacter sp.]